MKLPRHFALFCLLIIAAPAVAKPAGSMAFPSIRVENTDGGPLPGAQAAVRKEDHIPYFIDGWYGADTNGIIQIDVNRAKGHWESAIPEGRYRVMIRRPGYAPTTLQVDVPSSRTELSAVMQAGQEVQFQVKPYANSRLPGDLQPFVVDARVSTTTISSFHPSGEYNHLGEPLRMFDVEKTGTNTFKTLVPEGLDFPLLIVVAYPDYMQNYISREFSPVEFLQGEAVAELPVPGQVNVLVRPEETTATDIFKTDDITAGLWREGALAVVTTGTDGIDAKIRGVVPGEYHASVNAPLVTGAAESKQFPSYLKSALSVYLDPLHVTTGSQALLEQNYPLLPRNYFDGDGSATIAFKYTNGRSAKGLPYRVLGNTETYQNVPIRQGTIPEDGTINITGLRRKDIRYYDLQVGTVSASIITFTNDTHLSATRYIAPGKGDVAPGLTAWDLESTEPLSIADLRGKIVLLEFWATWCGPCQPNMQKLVDIASKMPPDLQDDVALITISVDEGPDEVKKRLKEKGWENGRIHHYWYGPGTPSARGGPYGVTSIPHAVIIGKDGKIAVPNYHVSDDLVEKLQELQE